MPDEPGRGNSVCGTCIPKGIGIRMGLLAFVQKNRWDLPWSAGILAAAIAAGLVARLIGLKAGGCGFECRLSCHFRINKLRGFPSCKR